MATTTRASTALLQAPHHVSDTVWAQANQQAALEASTLPAPSYLAPLPAPTADKPVPSLPSMGLSPSVPSPMAAQLARASELRPIEIPYEPPRSQIVFLGPPANPGVAAAVVSNHSGQLTGQSWPMMLVVAGILWWWLR